MIVKAINRLRDWFSYSKLSAFSKCPRLAFYRYVAKIKAEPREYLLAGRGTHAGQEYDNEERAKGGLPFRNEVLDRAVDIYETEGGELVDEFQKQHLLQLDAFWKSGEREKIEPLPKMIEAPFEIELFCTADPEVEPRKLATVQGFVDVVSGEGGAETVVDYKTVARPVTNADADNSIQASLYILGLEAEDKTNALGAKFVSFVKYKRQKAATKVSKVVYLTEEKRVKLLRFLNDTITSFRKNLVSGDFPKCDPACWWCSPEACDFYKLCYPKRDPGLVKYVSVEAVRPVGTLPQPDWRKRDGKTKADKHG